MTFRLNSNISQKISIHRDEKNNIRNNFNQTSQTAVKIWSSNFLKRNPELSLSKPEPTTTARVTGFEKFVVGNISDLPIDLMTR